MSFLPNPFKLLSIQKIWDFAAHNAFTDLIYFQGRWLCTFRESDDHVFGEDGIIYIIASDDGKEWQSIACICERGVDLRDPKLSVTPDGRLMLLVGGTVYDGKTYVLRQSRVAFSVEGEHWTPFTFILEPHEWLWRVTWHQGKAYGVSYRNHDIKSLKEVWVVTLFESDDGVNYRAITSWDISGYPNEATVHFLATGQMVVLLRRDGPDDNVAWIGCSSPPYRDWKWQPTHYYFGGPNFLILEDQTMWAAGRVLIKTPYGRQTKTVLAAMDLGQLRPLVTLPSGGDTGYPGMVYRGGEFWISYYSSHDKKAAIYLARLGFT